MTVGGDIVTTTRVTSREFNQHTSGAKRAARAGPVYITDRGRPSHVLLTFDDYTQLTARGTSIAELLSNPPGVADIHVEFPVIRDAAEPASFD